MATLPNRTFTLALLQEGTGKTAQVHISQDVKPFEPQFFLEVEKNTYDLPYTGGRLTIGFTSYKTTKEGGKEAIKPTVYASNSSESSWDTNEITDLTIGADGKGSFTLIAKENISYSKSPVTVTILQYCGDPNKKSLVKRVTVTLAEKPDDGVFTAEPMILRYQAAGGSNTTAITSTSKGKTVGWSVSNKADLPDWVTLSGEGTGTLSVTAKSSE